jgi:hypothetical protein
MRKMALRYEYAVETEDLAKYYVMGPVTAEH